jgi:biotin synthase
MNQFPILDRDDIHSWLLESEPERLEKLWSLADSARRAHVGDEVHVRGLVEFSNRCVRTCHYCGLRAGRRSLPRYRMNETEIMACVQEAVERRFGAVVLQSGEDPGLEVEWLAGVVRRIRRETPLAVTLSCGERSREELARWRSAGANRYLLRFETSDRELSRRIHPPSWRATADRLEMLVWIKELGYETGSGIMVGLPGQTWATLVDDIEWFRRLDLDMIGLGPYVPHPDTPLGRPCPPVRLAADQVPNTELAAYKVLALTRLLCPRVNLPSTTALATLDREHGWELGLQRGANVIMVDLTPAAYRVAYEIYPAKAVIGRTPEEQRENVAAMLRRLGRRPGAGAGTSRNFAARRPPAAAECPAQKRGDL